MTKTRYCHNAKTGEIFEYHEFDDGDTDFPRGIFMVYNDYIVTGFKTREAATEWGREWGECPRCKSARKSNNGKCNFCGSNVINHETK